MFKLLVLTALLAAASAAPYYGAPLVGAHVSPWGHGGYAPYAPLAASPWGHGLVGGPVLGAPVVKAALPVATSYANTVRVAGPSLVAPAPYAVAAHAPLVASPYAHAW